MEIENIFQDATQKKRRAKVLLYGTYGTGKTVLSLQFPRPVLIDMERGSECYNDKFSFKVFHTTDVDQVKKGVAWLTKNTTDRETIVLDSITEYWSALQMKWSETFLRRNKGKGNKEEYYDLQPRDWAQIKSEFKSFLRSLLSLDMNVICTSRVKDLYSEEVMLKKIGETFDCDRSLPYLFDTVVRLDKIEGRHIARVEKDRTGLLPPTFEASYSVFAYAFDLVDFEKAIIPDSYLPADLKGKSISGEDLATTEITWQSQKENGKQYKTRQLLHMWSSEKNPDIISKMFGQKLLQKYPSKQVETKVEEAKQVEVKEEKQEEVKQEKTV